MNVLTLPRHDELSATSRLAGLRLALAAMSLADWLLLGLFGALAATMSTLLDFSLKIPGDAILRAVFPMAAGLALVPRRGAGITMGGAAALTALGFQWGGVTSHGGGSGAFTSLLAIGPCLDFALWRARAGWRMWVGFAIAGVGANLLAMLVRGVAKSLQGGASLSEWLGRAPVTYLASGLVAGLLSGMVWFALQRRTPPESDGCSRLDAVDEPQ